MQYQFLKTSIDSGVGILQLNHPAKKNALGWELHNELIDALEKWAYDDRVAAVLVHGTEEYLCSGWALDTLMGTDKDGDERTKFVDLSHRLMITLFDYRKPTICAATGPCLGYGMDVANMCDITVAGKTKTRFGSSQVKYAMNGFYFGMIRKISAQNTRKLFFTGDSISAEEAYRIGMVAELAEEGKVIETALKLAKNIAENGVAMTTVLKEVALRANNMDHTGATAYELRVTSDLVQRSQFTRMIDEGVKRMKAKKSRALERL